MAINDYLIPEMLREYHKRLNELLKCREPEIAAGRTFRLSILDKNEKSLRAAVRDSVKQRDMQEMAISQTAADAVGVEVTQAMVNIITKTGVPLSCTQINVGRVNPPDAIKNQRVETAAQEQRAITEQQRKLAEDQRKMAEQSRAAADNAYREQMGLSPEQFIQLENIKMQDRVCEKGGCQFFIGTSLPVSTFNVHK
jgi:hypothetical protein